MTEYNLEDFTYNKATKHVEDRAEETLATYQGDGDTSFDIMQSIVQQTNIPPLENVDDDTYYSVTDSARLLDISRSYLVQRITANVISVRRLTNNRIMIKGSELHKFYVDVLMKNKALTEFRTQVTEDSVLPICGTEQAAIYLQRGQDYVRDVLIKENHIKASKLGTRWIIEVESLRAYKHGDSKIKYRKDAVLYQFVISSKEAVVDNPLLNELGIDLETDIIITLSINSKKQLEKMRDKGYIASRRYPRSIEPVLGFIDD